MKKRIIIAALLAIMLMPTLARANDYTYEYSNFVANVVIPQSGLCDFAKSYAGQENDTLASDYFSGIISAFRADLDADGDKELVLVGDNLVSVYRINDGSPAFVDSYEVTLVCDYGESYTNVFLKDYNGREYLCVENFIDSGSEKSYRLKMMYVDNNKLKLENQCSVEKVYRDDYSYEKASAVVGERTTSYSKTVSGDISSSVNPDNYSDLYDAAWQMFNAMGFDNPSFLNTVNRLILNENDTGMYFQITNVRQDVDLKTYVRATGIRTSSKPVVYFADYSELSVLNTAPELLPTSEPTAAPEENAQGPTASPSDADTEPTDAPVIYNDVVAVTINDELLKFPDQNPCIIDGRTLVPMRAIFEALGAKVRWLNEYRIVAAKKDNTDIFMRIDDSVYYVDEDERFFDVPPQIINDRTMIPARAVAEALGCTVEWDQATKTVIITTADYAPPTPEPTEAPTPDPTEAPELAPAEETAQ